MILVDLCGGIVAAVALIVGLTFLSMPTWLIVVLAIASGFCLLLVVRDVALRPFTALGDALVSGSDARSIVAFVAIEFVIINSVAGIGIALGFPTKVTVGAPIGLAILVAAVLSAVGYKRERRAFLERQTATDLAVAQGYQSGTAGGAFLDEDESGPADEPQNCEPE